MTVGLGICTYNRPDSLRRVLRGVVQHLGPVIDALHIYEDGSPEPAHSEYREMAQTGDTLVAINGWFTVSERNRGVAAAKNALMRRMLSEGHDWIFIGEDDILPTDPKAITGYIEACERSGLQHLNFHAHGPLNRQGGWTWPQQWPGVTLWPHYVGAWSIYSRESLEVCGLMDEGFVNAWEHVEHSLRLGMAGYSTVGKGNVADATGSEAWLRALEDQPSSIVSAVSSEVHSERIRAGQRHWHEHHPESYPLIFAGVPQ